MILNVNEPKKQSSKISEAKLIELQEEIDESAIIIGDFNIPLSEMDRPSRQKISKNSLELNNTINQLDLMDIYKPHHPTTAEYILFLKLLEIFTKIDNILDKLTILK